MLSDPDFLLDSFAEPEGYENDDFTRLCQAWVNEKCAPELLAFEEQLVENLLEMVESQSENLSEGHGESRGSLWENVCGLELERIQFVIRSYLRTRLTKIENSVIHYLEFSDNLAKLSSSEREYAQGFLDMMNAYYQESGLSTFPKALHGLDDQIGSLSMVVRPNMDASVICKVLENIGEVQLHEGWAFLEAPCCLQTITNTTIETRESIFMEKGNIYILRYKTVKSFLEKRMVEFT